MSDPRRVPVSQIIGTLQKRLKIRGGLGKENRAIIREVIFGLEGQLGGQGDGGFGNVKPQWNPQQEEPKGRKL